VWIYASPLHWRTCYYCFQFSLRVVVEQSCGLWQVLAAAGYMEPLTCATVGWASRTVNSKLQMALLDQSKTVVESMQNLLVAAKDAGGNRKVALIMN